VRSDPVCHDSRLLRSEQRYSGCCDAAYAAGSALTSADRANDEARDRLARFAPGRPERLLLHGGYVMTMDPGHGEFVGDVLIRGDVIEAVGTDLGTEGSDALVVDVSGQIVLPGLVDSHVHAWEAPIRGIAPDADFGNYLAITHGGIAKYMSPDDVAVGQRVTAAQALNGGVTTIVDNSHNSRTPAHSDAAIAALHTAGIRAVHAVGSPTAGGAGTHLPADLLRLRDEYFSSTDQLITLRMFDVTPSVESWTFAAERGFDVVAEMGMWIEDLDTLLATGLMREGHTYNHCAGLTDEQWRLIAASGAAINMVPRSDSQFGLGAFIPILQANKHGLQVGISCDNELSYGYDIFSEMRTLVTVQRGLSFAAEFAGETDAPRRYGPRDALRAATVGGALNAGLAGCIGSLTPGKKADVVVLDLDQVPTRPFGSLAGTVVNFAGIANVDLVLVDGIARKCRGRLIGTDYGALVAEAERSRESLLNQFGVSLDDIRFDRGLDLEPDAADEAVTAIAKSSGH
jgi:5-methylthioadenosine/S-adenosylhomocysteine deaminase